MICRSISYCVRGVYYLVTRNKREILRDIWVHPSYRRSYVLSHNFYVLDILGEFPWQRDTANNSPRRFLDFICALHCTLTDIDLGGSVRRRLGKRCSKVASQLGNDIMPRTCISVRWRRTWSLYVPGDRVPARRELFARPCTCSRVRVSIYNFSIRIIFQPKQSIQFIQKFMKQ